MPGARMKNAQSLLVSSGNSRIDLNMLLITERLGPPALGGHLRLEFLRDQGAVPGFGGVKVLDMHADSFRHRAGALDERVAMSATPSR
jgi:hypothetical protein